MCHAVVATRPPTRENRPGLVLPYPGLRRKANRAMDVDTGIAPDDFCEGQSMGGSTVVEGHQPSWRALLSVFLLDPAAMNFARKALRSICFPLK